MNKDNTLRERKEKRIGENCTSKHKLTELSINTF